MKGRFRGWDEVACRLADEARQPRPGYSVGPAIPGPWLDEGQRASLACLASMLPRNGALIADEVGMGKTRIAVAVARAVVESGGRVCILVPPNLGDQWRSELRGGGVSHWRPGKRHAVDPTPPFLRSQETFVDLYDETDPWFLQPVVLISQTFANWKLSATSGLWRWALLPLLYGQLRKRASDRFPNGYSGFGEEKKRPETLKKIAESVARAIPQQSGHPAYRRALDIMDAALWPQIMESTVYDRDGSSRKLLEQAVGLSLGTFNLVIIDEAHKGHGHLTGMSRMLNNVLLSAKDGRRLAMTATPVELGSDDWERTLARIGVETDRLNRISAVAKQYVTATRDVRMFWRTDEAIREKYRRASKEFQEALEPYILRRDKREDPTIRSFMERTREPVDAYRHETAVDISWTELSLPWRQAVCAAEALSQAASGSFRGKTKRDHKLQKLRLTIGNGHGIATILQAFGADDETDQDPAESASGTAEEGVSTSGIHDPTAPPDSLDKRSQRITWWQSILAKIVMPDGADSPHSQPALYEHPSIRKVVDLIEGNEFSKEEKILVFARFTRPMSALAALLNARAMIRHLQNDLPWPQASIPDDEHPAVRAALRQLGLSWSIEEINRTLAGQARKWERHRERESSIERIRTTLARDSDETRAFYLGILDRFTRQQKTASRAQLGLALQSLLDDPTRADATEYAKAFCHLVDLISGPSAEDDRGMEKCNDIVQRLVEYLHEEYGTHRGTYAQLMYGETKPETRRVRQAAFNRRNVFPRVLIAQSRVACEGLNLHQACRIVVMLHPEWNPAVAEQQVGRVDRKNSHWAKMFDDWLCNPQGKEVPRIEIRPVIFEGTYDEHHWNVLRVRWDDLRAQLHGIIVPQHERRHCSEEEKQLVRELDSMSPDFSPLTRIPASATGARTADTARHTPLHCLLPAASERTGSGPADKSATAGSVR